MTFTVVAVFTLPAASRATAVSAWAPLVAPVVFQLTLYGELVSSAPRLFPSSLNWTPATPMLSAAVAVTLTLPVTVALFAGAVNDTVGAVLSAFCTVTAIDDDVVVLPAASRATAVSVCAPSGT